MFDLLDEMANVTYIEFVYGRFIVSVDDVENNAGGNGYYWQYWVNDELGPVAADRFTLNDGDHILWKYCAPVYPSENSVLTEMNLFLGLAVIVLVGSLAIGIALFVNRRMR